MKIQNMTIKPMIYRQRRKHLAALLNGGIAIVRNSSDQIRSNDTHYPYRSNSYFHYLSGFPESESILVITSKPNQSFIFTKTKNKEKEIWDGFLYGPKKAAQEFLFEAGLDLKEFRSFLNELISTHTNFYLLQEDLDLRSMLSKALNIASKGKRVGPVMSNHIHSLNTMLDEMRSIKSKDEIEIIQKAANISSEAHKFAMANIHLDQYEYQVEARLRYEFAKNGARNEAYHSIVASGKNACTLHYIQNNAKLINGDLILIDAGCEYGCYASDITRTYPINGKFSAAQRDVYAIVLEAQKKAIECVKRNNAFNDPHETAVRVLAQGLKDLKIIKSSVNEIIEKQLYKKYFMHRTSHWMGLDVHDVGDYYDQKNNSIKLKDGQILTIEPGLYFQKNEKIPKVFQGMGIRIEDDVLVNGNSPIILTAKCPKEIQDLESIIGKG
ncbi:MAG: aminopeptidase P family protein [Methylophilaceae bacterium]